MFLDVTSSEVVETLGTATGVAVDVLTGLPEPVKQNLLHALSQLSSAAVGLATAHLEGRRREILSVYDARVSINRAVAQKVASQTFVSEDYVSAATHRSLTQIVGKQKNLDAIIRVAATEIVKETSADPQNISQIPQSEDKVTTPINEDWLNAFERYAADMSSDHMRVLFGKILAGEIRKPQSFSIRTLGLIAELDNEAASAFVDFCSIGTALKGATSIRDVKALTFGLSASEDGLREFGLSYRRLKLLREYGLIDTDFDAWISYSPCIERDGEIQAALLFQGKHYALKLRPGVIAPPVLQMHGVSLTHAGLELFPIVEAKQEPQYEQAWVQGFERIGFNLIRCVNLDK